MDRPLHFPIDTLADDTVSQGLLKDVGHKPATWLQSSENLMAILRRIKRQKKKTHTHIVIRSYDDGGGDDGDDDDD